ncbi:MAG: OstA-like protein [Ignavibacterium sp.]|jgi:lipopolysaccharide export system protein LptA|nr:OstA-like protein [Ignavibacterium sp.]
MKVKLTLICVFLLSVISIAQHSKLITVIGDSLVGRMVNGESTREVYGNVVLTQGKVRITCNKAIQYISRNEAELIGNVIATKDTLTIKTPHGYYFGNLEKTKSTSGVYLDDKKVILTADSGEYYFNEDRAFFQSKVKLYDTTTTLTSNQLTYYQQQNRAIAVGDVLIFDGENQIYADTLEHFRNTKITFAFSNVRLVNLKNNSEIFGQHLEDYRQKGYSLVDRDPLFIQVDTTFTQNEDGTETIQLDTLFIKSRIMEAYRDSAERFFAIDSVKILKENFASINDLTIFYRNDERIVTSKINSESAQPVLWNENSQLTGDSITIYLVENKIKQLDVDGSSFMLSQNENYLKRYDQTSSAQIKLFFNQGKIFRAEFYGNVFSIYYMYDGETANGLTKSNSASTTVIFENNEVTEVKLYKDPASEFYPEKQVAGNEKDYLLPRFVVHKNKPVKTEMYNLLNKFK